LDGAGLLKLFEFVFQVINVVLFVLAEGFKDPFASLIVYSGDGLQVNVTDPDFILDSRFNSFLIAVLIASSIFI